MNRTHAAIHATLLMSLVTTAGAATLEGSVWYRERMLTPPGTEVHVVLEDVSRADAPSETIAETRFTPRTAPPWPFTLDYDESRIDPRMRYALRARVEHQGRLLFINDTHVPAFPDGGAAPVEIMVVGMTAAGAQEPGVESNSWQPTRIDAADVTPGADDRPLQLTLEAGGVAGFAGCNRFMGSYTLDGESLAFGPLAATMMACIDQGDQEQRFLAALQATATWRLEDGELVLLDADGRPRLRFAAARQPDR